MRGSDQNASLYWLARMLEGGEDPLYVARRLVRFASEDIGECRRLLGGGRGAWRMAWGRVGLTEAASCRSLAIHLGRVHAFTCDIFIVSIFCFQDHSGDTSGWLGLK